MVVVDSSQLLALGDANSQGLTITHKIITKPNFIIFE